MLYIVQVLLGFFSIYCLFTVQYNMYILQTGGTSCVCQHLSIPRWYQSSLGAWGSSDPSAREDVGAPVSCLSAFCPGSSSKPDVVVALISHRTSRWKIFSLWVRPSLCSRECFYWAFQFLKKNCFLPTWDHRVVARTGRTPYQLSPQSQSPRDCCPPAGWGRGAGHS